MKKLLVVSSSAVLALCLTGCSGDESVSSANDSASGRSATLEGGTSSSRTASASSQARSEYPAGLYRVGEDISAGGYIYTRSEDEEFLMIDIWEDFSTNDPNEAIMHEWFTEEEAFISVKEGQTLEVQGGTFSPMS